jgi:hypothetical protein
MSKKTEMIDALKVIADGIENLTYGSGNVHMELGPELEEKANFVVGEMLETNEHLKGIECHLGSIADTLSRMLVLLAKAAK